jgi:hypothetical protein
MEISQFPIVCLCGSSKQKEDWERCAHDLALKGYCVLNINVYLGLEKADYNKEDKLKKRLMAIHRQKIRMSDIVAVIRKRDGDIGDHTAREIVYAKKLGKRVIFVEYLLQSKQRIWK